MWFFGGEGKRCSSPVRGVIRGDTVVVKRTRQWREEKLTVFFYDRIKEIGN